MNKLSIRSTIEIFGVLGVIASLLFVGMQLRLDREVALGEQFSQRASRRIDTLARRAASDDFLRREVIDLESGMIPTYWTDEFVDYYTQELIENRGYTLSDIVQLELEAAIDLYTVDNVVFQYQNGLISEEFWGIYREATKALLQDPFRRMVFLAVGRPVSPDAQELFQALISEMESEGRM